MAMNLYEISPFKASILKEAAENNGRMVVEGVFQAADLKNANGRIYPKSLWEKVLRNEDINRAVNERRMFGELDHPMDGKWRLANASHIVTSMTFNEATGQVMGRAEILDTPNGKILQELFNAGATVGISSRGSGSVKQTPAGLVVQEDFKLETYDFVANPSTIGAYPQLVREEVETPTEKETYMDLKDKLAVLEQRASSVLNLKAGEITEGLRSVVDGVATTLVMDLAKLGSDSPEVKSLTEDLIDQINTKRRSIRTALNEEKEEKKELPPFMKKGKDKDEDDDKDDKKKKEDKKEESVEEETSGSADQGFHRSVPVEAAPAQGEGWPINPNDAGVLAGINNGVDEFMSSAEPIPESEEGTEDGEEVEESVNDVLSRIAYNICAEEVNEENFVARAFAGAFLMENGKRVSESQAYARVIEKLQDKMTEAAETGTVTLIDEESELQQKYEATLASLEELQTRHRLLSAKVYAEQQLEKLGLKEDADARKKIAEAIRNAATKPSIDEAISALATIKGLKITGLISKEIIKEEKNQPPAKTLEGTVSKLSEEKNDAQSHAMLLSNRLSASMNYSRSK
jgi:hypothetical protein